MSDRILLEDVIRCCHYLESDKATDRKKNADKLKNLLQHPQLLQILDTKSKTGKAKDGTYTSVFKSVQGYLFQESETARNKWDTFTVIAQSNKKVKLVEICTLLRLVSKTAVRNGPKLRCNDIIDSILLILKRKFQSKLFGKTYLDILTEDLLTHRKYVNQITLEQYKELFSYICNCYKDVPEHLGPVQVAQVLKCLLQSVSLRYDPLEFCSLFDFFTETVEIIRKSGQATHMEHSLCALQKFVEWQALANHSRVVLLGQEIMPALVGLLSSKKLSKPAQKLCIEICHSQLNLLAIHGKENEHFFGNLLKLSEWFQILQSIVMAAEKQIALISSSNKFSSKVKNINVDEDICKIASQALCILFQQFPTYSIDNGQTVPTTQFASNVSSLTFSQPSQILAVLSTYVMEDVVCSVHWLQILADFLHTLEMPPTTEEIREFAVSFHQITTTSKSHLVVCKAFSCLSALLPNLNYEQNENLEIWRKVIDSAFHHMLSSLSSKSLVVFDVCSQFLSDFLKIKRRHKLVISTASLFPRLWQSNVESVIFSEAFVSFLSSFVHTHNIQEMPWPKHNCLTSNQENQDPQAISLVEKRPTRFSLIDEFLGLTDLEVSVTPDCKSTRGSFQTQTQSGVNSSFFSAGDRKLSFEETVNVKLMKMFVRNGSVSVESVPDSGSVADLVISLCCKKPSAYFDFCQGMNPSFNASESCSVSKCKVRNGMSQEFASLDDVCSFVVNQLQSISLVTVENLKNVKSLFSINICQAIHVADLLMAFAARWAFDGLKKIVYSTDLLLTCISDEMSNAFAKANRLTTDLVKKMVLFTGLFKKPLQYLIKCQDAHRKSLIIENLKVTLQTCGKSISKFAQEAVSSIGQPIVENKAISVAPFGSVSSEEISFSEQASTSLESNSSRFSYRRKRYGDKHTDSPPAKKNSIGSNQSFNTEAHEDSSIVMSDDAKDLYTKCVSILCLLTKLFDGSVVGGILNTITAEDFDLTPVHNVDILITTVKEISNLDGCLDSVHLQNLIHSIQSILKLHYQDEEISTKCLEAIAKIVPVLYTHNSSSQEQCKDEVFSILSIISDLINNDKCGPMLKVSLINCLVALSRHLSFEYSATPQSNELKKFTSVVSALWKFLASPNAYVSLNASNAFSSIVQHQYENEADHTRFAEFCQYAVTCLDQAKDEITNKTSIASRNLNSDELFYLQHLTSLQSCLSTFCDILHYSNHPEVAEKLCLFHVNLHKKISNRHSNALDAFDKVFKEVISCSTKKYGGDNLLLQHLPYILSKWEFSPQKLFVDFPYSLWGCKDLEAFCQKHFVQVYPIVMLRSCTNLDQTIEFLQNVPCLVQLKEYCIPQTIALTLPLLCQQGLSNIHVTDSSSLMNILHYLMQCCDYDHVSSLLQYFMPQIISHLLTMLHVSSCDADDGDLIPVHETPPITVMHFDEHAFEVILLKLVNLSLKDTKKHCMELNLKLLVKMLETSSQARMQNFMIHLYRMVEVSSNVAEILSRFIAYRYFIVLIFPYVSDDQQKEIMIHSALHSVSNICNKMSIKVHTDASKLLKHLVLKACSVGINLIYTLLSSSLNDDLSETWKVVKQPMFVNATLQCLNAVVQTVVEVESVGACSENCEILLRKLMNLLTDNQSVCDAYKPALHNMAAVSQKLNCLMLPMHSDIPFDTPKMTDSSCGHKNDQDSFKRVNEWIRNIEFVLKLGKTKDHSALISGAIINLSAILPKICDSDVLPDNEERSNMVKYVVILLSQVLNNDPIIKESVGKCFGILGLKPFGDTVVLFESRKSQKSFSRVLLQVWQDCVDPNPSLQLAATDCLVNTLQHNDSALVEMRESEQLRNITKYLQSFKSSKKASKLPDASDPLDLLRQKSMWSCDQEKHFDWLCENTWKLVSCCKEPHIRTMEELTKLSPRLCEQLFPFVFNEVAKSSAKNAELLGKCLNTGFESALNQVGRKINQEYLLLLLRVVQHIREHSRKTTKEEPKDVRRSPRKDTGSTFTAKVDYLLAARVATICRRPFMAVLFVELWIDELELKMENEIESSKTGRERKSTSRALSFTGEVFTEPKESTAAQEHIKQILSLRSRGVKSPMAILQTSELGSEAKKVLIASYDSIGELDGLNGCYACYPIDPVGDTALIHLREKEGRWNDAMKMHDLVLSSGPHTGTSKSMMVECLQQSGLNHLCDVYMRNVDAKFDGDTKQTERDENLAEIQYKAAWQSCQWDQSLLNIQDEVSYSKVGFHQHLHNCMSSVFDNGGKNLERVLMEARTSCLSDFGVRQPNHVIASDLHNVSCRLQCLLEVESAQKCLSAKIGLHEFLQSLGDFEETMSRAFRFNDVSTLLGVRSSVLKSLAERNRGTEHGIQTLEAWYRHLLLFMRVCCQHDRLQNAQKLLRQLSDVTSRLSDGGSRHVTWDYKVKLEGAKLLWKQKETSFALASLQSMLSQLETTINGAQPSSDVSSLKLMLAESLQTYGVWLHESRYEGPSVIMEDYLERSVSVVDKVYKSVLKSSSSNSVVQKESLQLLVKNYHMLAKFADEQYQQVIKYKKSSEYAQKRVLASAPKQELESMQQSGQAPARKTQVIVDKNLNIDKQELSRIEEKTRDFLSSALRSYIQCVQLSDQYDILMYRICALWFENPNLAATNSLMSSGHKNIPSYKFIPLSYQLAARLNTTTGDFQNTLREVLLRVTVDHPHHVLGVILALANAKKDEDFSAPNFATAKRKSKKSASKENLSSRVTAATSLLAKIRQRRQTLVQHTELIMNAYIEFANFDVSAWKSQPNVKIELPSQLALAKFANSSKLCPNIQDVVMPICKTPISKNANYSDGIVTFRYIKPYFETVGGVNLPKVLVAVGSDGVARKHLVKGRDDLRQDAVMQQVFETVNSLLQQVHDTSGLRIRTYRVTPLSQRSGLVEWCGGTTPIGTYLVGNSQQIGAHHRYRPTDTPVLKCRKMLAGIANQPHVIKMNKFREICSSLRPVFRHFFTERYLDPAEWFAKRRAYTKSVAASSIVGYILGLGDRHVQNILIDFETAELIHIDLGVAFEQGKCLPTPETVPFRLTRDIVDGMGASGVEGIFRRCCERTMQAMRSSYDIITTIVEVLLYDPLHEWTLTPSKAQHIQPQTVDLTESMNTSMSTLNTSARDFMTRVDAQGCEQLNTNKLAERVLLRLQEKLRGQEEGSVLSVCGQVNMLIQQASDPARLCQLFAGWQPYL